jgi:hypothetical protein
MDLLCEVLGELDDRFDLQHAEHRQLMQARAGSSEPAEGV